MRDIYDGKPKNPLFLFIISDHFDTNIRHDRHQQLVSLLTSSSISSHNITSHVDRFSVLFFYMCVPQKQLIQTKKYIYICIRNVVFFYLSWYDTTFRIPWASERERAREWASAAFLHKQQTHSRQEHIREKKKKETHHSYVYLFHCACCLFLLNRIITLFLLTMFVAQDCLV